jgi:hypothetical protein
MRIGIALLGLVSAFWGAVFVSVLIDLGGTATCDDATLLDAGEECFDGSGLAKTLTLIFGWPSALAFIAALPPALYYAVKGRGARLFVLLAGAALALGLVTFVAARL